MTVATALLYDDTVRASGLDLLRARRPELPDLWRRAAADGVHDPELRDLACSLWRIALAGARRLPDPFVGGEALATAEAFLEHFTDRGRTPGDDLADLLAEDPARALAWASSEEF